MDRNRFRPDIRPGFVPGRMGDRPMRPRMDDRNMGPRHDWRERERFDNIGGQHGGFRPRGAAPASVHKPMDRQVPEGFPRGPDRDMGQQFAGHGPRMGPPQGPGPAIIEPPRVWDDPKQPPPRPVTAPGSGPPLAAGDTRTNDVEIIVSHKRFTEYAEFVERRLKKMGLTCDLLFPNEDVPLGRVLANISNRGSLFALVINPSNFEYKSVSVNILYGVTQEHRNLPLEDGLSLLMRNFEAHMRGEKEPVKPYPGGIIINAAGEPLLDKHPDAVQTLLDAIAVNKPVTANHLDKIISYLQEKRDEQIKKEGEVAAETQIQQAQLQNRILNILNSSDNRFPVEKPTFPIIPPTKDTTIIQKAVENIVQSNLFRNPPIQQGPRFPPPFQGRN